MESSIFLQKMAEQQGVRVQLWLENAEGKGFGKGRIQLLKLVDDTGSISKAAKEMNMSYRGAWGKLRKAEQIAGVPLLEASGSKRNGCRLTAQGRHLVQCFLQWYADVASFANQRADELFNHSALK